ncbi:MAG: hypothetical protein OXG09_02485 [Chloroflexi bacterium]|nr:hypothetical protein [Chloroflexota bacterium]
MQPSATTNEIQECHYDPAQDMLFVLFEPLGDGGSYRAVSEDRHVMRRYRLADDRLFGISLLFASRRLGTENPSPQAVRQLAEQLVARYACAGTMRPQEG